MSAALLQNIASFLEGQNLLTNYDVKYYSWTDADFKGKGNFIVLRMAGTAGLRDHVVQRPDVRVLVVVDGKHTVDGNNKADEIFSAFAGLSKPSGVLKLEPIGTVIGPFGLENGRQVFEINVRCYVQDH